MTSFSVSETKSKFQQGGGINTGRTQSLRKLEF